MKSRRDSRAQRMKRIVVIGILGSVHAARVGVCGRANEHDVGVLPPRLQLGQGALGGHHVIQRLDLGPGFSRFVLVALKRTINNLDGTERILIDIEVGRCIRSDDRAQTAACHICHALCFQDPTVNFRAHSPQA